MLNVNQPMKKCCQIQGLSSNITDNYLWHRISEDRRYFILYGSSFIELYTVPYGNILLQKHLATFRIKKHK